jgi:hypothetical protein
MLDPFELTDFANFLMVLYSSSDSLAIFNCNHLGMVPGRTR